MAFQLFIDDFSHYAENILNIDLQAAAGNNNTHRKILRDDISGPLGELIESKEITNFDYFESEPNQRRFAKLVSDKSHEMDMEDASNVENSDNDDTPECYKRKNIYPAIQIATQKALDYFISNKLFDRYKYDIRQCTYIHAKGRLAGTQCTHNTIDSRCRKHKN